MRKMFVMMLAAPIGWAATLTVEGARPPILGAETHPGSPPGSGRAKASGRLCGDSGKHRVVAEQRWRNSGCARVWQATPLVAGSVPGTSRRPRPCLWGFPMPISNRSDFRHCSRTVSVTDSNRRVRTRTHGGVAGVTGPKGHPGVKLLDFGLAKMDQAGEHASGATLPSAETRDGAILENAWFATTAGPKSETATTRPSGLLPELPDRRSTR
jgi:hypothetical protein